MSFVHWIGNRIRPGKTSTKRLERLQKVWYGLLNESPENNSEFLKWQSRFGLWIQEVLPLIDDEPRMVVADQDFRFFNKDHLLMLQEGHKISKNLEIAINRLKIGH